MTVIRRFLSLAQDQRDDRPLTYQGKFAVSPNEPGFWKKSTLYSTGRTEMCRQVPGKEMRVVENLLENALPFTTDGDYAVKGSQKYAQMGEDACHKLLQALVEPCLDFASRAVVETLHHWICGLLHSSKDQMAFGAHQGIMLVDLFPGVGNMFEAFAVGCLLACANMSAGGV